MRLAPLFAAASVIASGATLVACRADGPPKQGANGKGGDTLLVYVAASLTKPLQPLLDTLAAQTGIVIHRESGASLEHARKITELHRIPDVILLADYEVFPRLLAPTYIRWFSQFARNRMVVAYTPTSKYASTIDTANWTDIVRRPDVRVGRTDPSLAPAGYRALLTMQLAERHYRVPGLARALLENAPDRNIRANASDLAALLAAGELDYIYDYESVARANAFRYVTLPPEIDLGDPDHAEGYATAAVRVRTNAAGATIEIRGEPILYAYSVPTAAPHAAAATRFVELFLSSKGRAILTAGHVDLLERPIVHFATLPGQVDVIHRD